MGYELKARFSPIKARFSPIKAHKHSLHQSMGPNLVSPSSETSGCVDCVDGKSNPTFSSHVQGHLKYKQVPWPRMFAF